MPCQRYRTYKSDALPYRPVQPSADADSRRTMLASSRSGSDAPVYPPGDRGACAQLVPGSSVGHRGTGACPSGSGEAARWSGEMDR
jgi:hypothetical protein